MNNSTPNAYSSAHHNSGHDKYTHQRLLFVGESNPQLINLMNMTSERFGLPSGIFGLDGMPIRDLANALGNKPDTLIILDCLTLSERNINIFLQTIDPRRLPGIVLINVEPNTEPETLGKWKHVLGIQHTNVDQELFLTGFDRILNGGLWLPRRIMESLIRKDPRQKFWNTTGYVYPDL